MPLAGGFAINRPLKLGAGSSMLPGSLRRPFLPRSTAHSGRKSSVIITVCLFGPDFGGTEYFNTKDYKKLPGTGFSMFFLDFLDQKRTEVVEPPRWCWESPGLGGHHRGFGPRCPAVGRKVPVAAGGYGEHPGGEELLLVEQPGDLGLFFW